MSNLKVEGKVADWCPRCKNCKSTTRECNGEKDWLTEVKCEDPYDGMIKTLAADSDICCSMFTPKNESMYSELIKASKRKDELIQNYREKLKKENEAGSKIVEENVKLENKIKNLTDTNIKLMERNVELVAQCDETYEKFRDCERVLHDILNEVYEHPEMFERNMTVYELLPGRVKTLKDSWEMMCDKYDPLNVKNEQLKRAIDNQFWMIQDLKKERDELAEKLKNTDISKVDNLQSNINFQKYLKDEAYKREDKLKKELNKVKAHDEALTKHFQNDEKLIDNIQKVIFPQEEGSDYAYSYDEILNKVKEFKVQSDENGTMYEDLKYWEERCHKAETDVTTLNSKVEVLNKRNTNQFVMIGDKDKEIENLKKMVDKLEGDVDTLQNECLAIAEIAKRAYDDTNRD